MSKHDSLMNYSEPTQPETDQIAAVEELLTAEDVARILNVPISWVYSRTRNRRGDKLPHIRLGKYVRFEEAAIRDYLARKRRAV